MGEKMKQKHAHSDFTIDKLPHNRWSSLTDVLSHRFFALLKLGLILLLFMMPVVGLQVFSNLHLFEIESQVVDGLIPYDDGATQIFSLINAVNLLVIPCLMLFGCGLAGVVRVIRLFIWQEGVFIGFDWKKGVHQNKAAFMTSFCILGVMHYVIQYLIRYGYFIEESTLYTIALIFSCVLAVYALPTFLFVLLQADLYQMSFFSKSINGLLLTIRTAFLSIPVVFLSFTPWVLLFFDSGYFYIPIFVLLIVVYLPIQILILMEYGFGVLDQYINKTHHPEIFEKGVWRSCPKSASNK